MSPARWVWAICSDFSGSVGIRGKRGLLGAGGGICDPADQWPIAWDLPEIAIFLGESHKPIQVPRAVGLRHLL